MTFALNGLEAEKLDELSNKAQECKSEVLRRALQLYHFLKMRGGEGAEIQIVTKKGESVEMTHIPPEFI